MAEWNENGGKQWLNENSFSQNGYEKHPPQKVALVPRRKL